MPGLIVVVRSGKYLSLSLEPTTSRLLPAVGRPVMVPKLSSGGAVRRKVLDS